MTFVIGRDGGVDAGPAGLLGAYRALDGSEGAKLYLDLDAPHATLIVGKRGYGKSYTLGVIAEALARTAGVAPTIVDPMGAFGSITEPVADGADDVPAVMIDEPAIAASALDPRSWCVLLGLSPESGAGTLVWQAASATDTLAEMRAHVEAAAAPGTDVRAARNHLDLADSWDAFDPEGLDAAALAGPEVTVVDVSALDAAPTNAVVRGVAEALYRARVEARVDRLPWLLIDEAHTFFDGVAASALRTILTRGRAPGVSLVCATQRPSAVPDVGVSQSDVLVSHRLTAADDIDALERAQPTYVDFSLDEGDRMPAAAGEAIVVDDATETAHAVRVRDRDTPHGGASPRASDVFPDGAR